ncbi:receptor-like protein EIX1 [Telopea speciosissima]|uniref:receptor-like protein EIX1 n=1 Tax=Telopea speciosissima TaxID=54955 RepID=UPI001CC3F9DB|nr:receptor-like protein EIX1 [Telopea speciosissima]
MSSMDCSSRNKSIIQLLLLLFLSGFSSCINIGDPNNARCKEMERKALLKFKEGIKDHTGRLSSWTTTGEEEEEEEDCCRWRGVRCSTRTGHVVHLNLRNPIQLPQYDDDDHEDIEAFKRSRLSGEIYPSWLNLKYLKYMDLSLNQFRGIKIPEFLGSFKKLRYLNLSHSFFAGTVPPHLGNLSTLHHLDLSSSSLDYYSFSEDPSWLMRVDNLEWISGLSSLEYLNMGYVNLSNAADDWFQAFNKLSLLRELKLSDCELGRLPSSSETLPSSITVNFTSLSVLDLSWNFFNNSFLPHWLLNISSLEDLDLSYNELILNFSYSNNNIISSIHSGAGGGDAASSRTTAAGRAQQQLVGSLWKLRRLDLSYNNGGGGGDDVGALVDGLSGFSNKSLEILVLSYSELSGHLPISI